eukprot:4981981-Alexandrium_andersonii.AAC.1
MQQDHPRQVRLALPCDVRKLFGSQGKVFGLVSGDISSTVSFALAMRPAGAIDKLRVAISS